MIEIGFAIILGFSITSTLCGLLEDWSRHDRILIRALVYLILLSLIVGIVTGGSTNVRAHAGKLIFGSVFVHTIWMLLGAMAALSVQIFTEGYLYQLWVKFHPQSAPTPEVQMGQRAQIAGFRTKKAPATLVGTSTKYLNSELDLHTETLIRLSYSVFEERDALMMSRLEAELRLGTGHRQKAFYKIVAGNRGRPNIKQIAHRYWRSVNGSSRMSQALFAQLCKLARNTNNSDRATLRRLSLVGEALCLSSEEMARGLKAAV